MEAFSSYSLIEIRLQELPSKPRSCERKTMKRLLTAHMMYNGKNTIGSNRKESEKQILLVHCETAKWVSEGNVTRSILSVHSK